MIRITLKRSIFGIPAKHRNTLVALGLKKINSSVVKKDDVAIRGMINRVCHLVAVEKAD